MSLYKEIEIKMQNQLYGNIHLLTLLHPTSRKFKNVFQPVMFAKNNKEAFHHVMHYLLTILMGAQEFKREIPSWPIFDKQRDSEFRCEVIRYLNKLNDIYPDANIPTVIASHLICPGGYKFTSLMLKLSQLVLSEELQRDDRFSGDVFHRIKPNKSSKVTQNTLQQIVSVNRETIQQMRQMRATFEEKLLADKGCAQHIFDEMTKAGKTLECLRNKSRLEEVDGNDVISKAHGLQMKFEPIKSTLEKFQQLVECIESLYQRHTLSFAREHETVPKSGELVGPDEELNLLDYLRRFDQIMSELCLEIDCPTYATLQTHLESYTKLVGELGKMPKLLEDIFAKYKRFQENLADEKRLANEHVGKNICSEVVVCDSSVLAVPLKEFSDL